MYSSILPSIILLLCAQDYFTYCGKLDESLSWKFVSRFRSCGIWMFNRWSRKFFSILFKDSFGRSKIIILLWFVHTSSSSIYQSFLAHKELHKVLERYFKFVCFKIFSPSFKVIMNIYIFIDEREKVFEFGLLNC